MSGKALTGHLELLLPSNYIKAADLKGKDVTIKIDRLERETLIMAGGKRDEKIVVFMRSLSGVPLKKRWVINKTNLRGIAASVGEKDVERWSGKPVTIYGTTCKGADGKQVECIRVRVKVARDQGEPTEEMMAAPLPPPQEFLEEIAAANEPQAEAPTGEAAPS